ncbi:MAG: M67 family metallopeptidase [Gammaproteobacteria bacterium]|nr:M67 family metallopeptidase [Gammaproteobacteria bacterium]
MAMYITDVIRSDMLKHARISFPKECCGFIVGSTVADDHLNGNYPNSNKPNDVNGRFYVACEPTFTPHCRWRFSVDPQLFQQVAAEALELNLQIICVVHSHPNHSDLPSEFDRQHAIIGLNYLIISVCDGRVHSYNAWQLPDPSSIFVAQDIIRLE